MKTSYLFLSNGFEEIEAVTIINILRRAKIDLKIVSMEEERAVIGEHGITLMADVLYSKTKWDNSEFFILPGGIGSTKDFFMNDSLKIDILEHYNQGRYIAAIGESPAILGELGILNEKNATALPAYMNFLQGATYTGLPIEIQDNVITGRGAADSLKFAIGIVSMLKGKDVADDVSKELLLIVG